MRLVVISSNYRKGFEMKPHYYQFMLIVVAVIGGFIFNRDVSAYIAACIVIGALAK